MPVIIGGTGGSGTRVVANILIQAGIYMGQDLNTSLDNSLFTYLFKRPKRFAKDYNRLNPTHHHLHALHERLFFGHRPTHIQEFGMIAQAGWDHTRHGYGWRWVLERWRHMISMPPVTADVWGWKEPNSIYCLHGIRAYYPHSQFILVVRNGLDMAYSDNSQQLKNWGDCFQIDPGDLSPPNRFECWYRSNRQVMTTARALFGAEFLMIKFEDLWFRRHDTIRQLLEFVQVDLSHIAADIYEIPRQPSSYGRYRQFDMTWIDSGVRQKLAEIGYESSQVEP